MERPALQQLLTHISEGQIDVVVVYKVDRLTRALADFARMVELFDDQSVSFVAVTQQFNTTTSMGRLTLNVLLSFAQFEREVIGERIRDKVAASKRKGIWMGGTLPMGYDVHERKLVINQNEAQNVREIFERYLELGSVRELKKDLDRRGIVSALKLRGRATNEAANRSHAERSTACSPTASTAARSATSSSLPGTAPADRKSRVVGAGAGEAVRSCGARRRGAQDRGNAKSASGQAVRRERRAALRSGRGQGSTTLSLLRFQAAGKRRFGDRCRKELAAIRALVTRPAAEAVADVQHKLTAFGLSLLVYDCYRPQSAVDYFVRWAASPSDNHMKREFYPHVEKTDLFKDGYVASPSSHSRASTVDLTIVPLPRSDVEVFAPGKPLTACDEQTLAALSRRLARHGYGLRLLRPAGASDGDRADRSTTSESDAVGDAHDDKRDLRDTATNGGTSRCVMSHIRIPTSISQYGSATRGRRCPRQSRLRGAKHYALASRKGAGWVVPLFRHPDLRIWARTALSRSKPLSMRLVGAIRVRMRRVKFERRRVARACRIASPPGTRGLLCRIVHQSDVTRASPGWRPAIRRSPIHCAIGRMYCADRNRNRLGRAYPDKRNS